MRVLRAVAALLLATAAGAGAPAGGQVAAPSRPKPPALESRVESLLRRMTLEEKLGQLQQLDGHADGGYRPEHLELAQRGSPRLDAQRAGRGQRQRAAEGGRRGLASPDPAPVRLRHHPRLPHDLPHPAGGGGQLRSRAGRSHGPRRRRRGGRGGPQVDLRAHGRRRARSRAGAGSPKARGKTRTWAACWPAPACAGSRATTTRSATAWWPPPSTGSATAPRRPAATTTPPTSRSGRCARSISRRSRRRWTPAWALS